jgi:hypothetical protein
MLSVVALAALTLASCDKKVKDIVATNPTPTAMLGNYTGSAHVTFVGMNTQGGAQSDYVIDVNDITVTVANIGGKTFLSTNVQPVGNITLEATDVSSVTETSGVTRCWFNFAPITPLTVSLMPGVDGSLKLEGDPTTYGGKSVAGYINSSTAAGGVVQYSLTVSLKGTFTLTGVGVSYPVKITILAGKQ